MILSIIVAGGRGLRMKSDIRKQYLHLDGIPVLSRTLEVFNNYPDMGQILLVVPKEDFEFVQNNILSFSKAKKNIKLVPGGERRQDSVYHGMCEIEDEDSLVVVHDGVRPFVSREDITNCVSAAQKYGAGILGIPAHDTLKQVDGDAFINKTIERKAVWLAQTPQVFQYRLLRDAHEAARKKRLIGTDDACLVEDMGQPIKMVMGNKYNIKITTPEDLKFAEAILQIMV